MRTTLEKEIVDTDVEESWCRRVLSSSGEAQRRSCTINAGENIEETWERVKMYVCLLCRRHEERNKEERDCEEGGRDEQEDGRGESETR